MIPGTFNTLRAIPQNLFHGSVDPALESFSVAHSDEKHPFGPAIYLTEDPHVANCYVGRRGAIYMVNVQGSLDQSIALDQSWRMQTADAIRVIVQLLWSVGHREIPDFHESARTVIDLAIPALGKRRRNQFLHQQGIWLLYGHVDVYEDSGQCDRGV